MAYIINKILTFSIKQFAGLFLVFFFFFPFGHKNIIQRQGNYMFREAPKIEFPRKVCAVRRGGIERLANS